jgi:hypothetical protein
MSEAEDLIESYWLQVSTPLALTRELCALLCACVWWCVVLWDCWWAEYRDGWVGGPGGATAAAWEWWCEAHRTIVCACLLWP